MNGIETSDRIIYETKNYDQEDKVMRKVLIIVMMMLLVFAIATASVFASGAGNGNSAVNVADRICPAINECVNSGQCVGNYVDQNNDGICDNRNTDASCVRARAGHHDGGYGHVNGCRR